MHARTENHKQETSGSVGCVGLVLIAVNAEIRPLFRLQRHRDEADDRGNHPDEAPDRGGLDRVQRVEDAAGDARHVLQGLQPHKRKGIPPR